MCFGNRHKWRQYKFSEAASSPASDKKPWKYFRYQLVEITVKYVLKLCYYSNCAVGKHYWELCHSAAFLPKDKLEEGKLFSCKCRHAQIKLDACCSTRRIWEIKEFTSLFPRKREMFKTKWVDRKIWGSLNFCLENLTTEWWLERCIQERVQILDANKHFWLKAGLDYHNSLFLYPNLQDIYRHANTGFACMKMVTWVYKQDSITVCSLAHLILVSRFLMLLFSVWCSQKYNMFG